MTTKILIINTFVVVWSFEIFLNSELIGVNTDNTAYHFIIFRLPSLNHFILAFRTASSQTMVVKMTFLLFFTLTFWSL